MKKIIRLTERDLTNLIKRMVRKSEDMSNQDDVSSNIRMSDYGDKDHYRGW